jgi:hypothetical protein
MNAVGWPRRYAGFLQLGAITAGGDTFTALLFRGA